MPNSDEIAFWNDQAGPRWAAFQERIDRALAPLGAAGVAAARLRAGEAVLDIGCGCGATLLQLASAVGTDGRVVGVDVSREMLAVAQRRTIGVANVRCVLADASTESFGDGAFDCAFSRFGVMFFDDPVGAFANIRRSVKPGGRLVFVCWRELAANPWFYVPAEAIRAHVPEPPKLPPEAPGPLAFADPGRVRAILERAGFEGVRFEPFDAQVRLGGRESANEFVSQIGPVSRLLADADERALPDAKRALDDAFEPYETDGEVVLGAGVWIVSALRGHRP